MSMSIMNAPVIHDLSRNVTLVTDVTDEILQMDGWY